MMGYGDGWGGAAWVWFGLMHMLWWVLLIVGIVILVRWVAGSDGKAGRHVPESRALEILHERYARGEISKEEYEERKRTIKS